MVTTLNQIDIKRPAAEVFGFVTDPAKATLWQAGLVEITGEKGMPAGSTGTVVTQAMGQRLTMRFEVLENDGRGFTRARSNQGPIQFETVQRVKALTAGRARYTIQTKIDAGRVFRLAESALESIVRSRMEADLAALKGLLEAGELI